MGESKSIESGDAASGVCDLGSSVFGFVQLDPRTICADPAPAVIDSRQPPGTRPPLRDGNHSSKYIIKMHAYSKVLRISQFLADHRGNHVTPWRMTQCEVAPSFVRSH